MNSLCTGLEGLLQRVYGQSAMVVRKCVSCSLDASPGGLSGDLWLSHEL